MATITDVVCATDSLRALTEALAVTGLDETLSGEGPLTLFAPTDDAFAELGADRLLALAADPDELLFALLLHVVNGRYPSSDLVDTQLLVSGAGSELLISEGDSSDIYVEEARIVEADIEVDNGVIHLIDLVILPLASEEVITHDRGDIVAEALGEPEPRGDEEREPVSV